MRDSRHITRFDYGRTHGFWVRITRVDAAAGKRTVSKLFSDNVYGGVRKALAAARTWRDRMVRKLPPPAKSWRQTAPGYGYIYRTTISRRAGTAEVWVAWIKLGPGRGECKQTSASIERWGSREAKRRCEAWIRLQRSRIGSK